MKTNELETLVLSKKLPSHIGIILDGNGRWATSRNLPRVMGHQEGIKRVEEIIDYSYKLGIKELSLYCFSTENWKRSIDEVQFLMDLFKKMVHKWEKKYQKTSILFRIIGEEDYLDEEIIKMIERINSIKKEDHKLRVNICFNYGSRKELLEMVKHLSEDISLGKIRHDAIDDDLIRSYLKISDDCDLIIRTSGEKRLSNFLLYQASYAELCFTDCLWPDFTKRLYLEIIDDYQNRKRRFGGN